MLLTAGISIDAQLPDDLRAATTVQQDGSSCVSSAVAWVGVVEVCEAGTWMVLMSQVTTAQP